MKKKINKKIIMIILIILLILLSLGIGAYAAYVLNATEVQYTKSDGTTVSVKSALDDLYYKTNKVAYYIGDEVTIGTEHFYVMKTTYRGSNQLYLAAKYPLDGNTFNSSNVKQKTSPGISSVDKVRFNAGVSYSNSNHVTLTAYNFQTYVSAWADGSVPKILSKYYQYVSGFASRSNAVFLTNQDKCFDEYFFWSGDLEDKKWFFCGDNDPYEVWEMKAYYNSIEGWKADTIDFWEEDDYVDYEEPEWTVSDNHTACIRPFLTVYLNGVTVQKVN